MKLAPAVLLLLLFCSVASADEPPAQKPVLASTGGFFALHVPKLAESVAWYREKLGLRVSMEVPKNNGVAVAVLEGEGLIVELIQNDQIASSDGGEQTGAAPRHGFFKAGIVIHRFDETVKLLRARGVDIAYGPFPAKPNQRANVLIRDNAGNLIQLFGN